MSVTDLDCEVLIGGVDYAAYVLSLERVETFNQPGATISLVMSAAFPFTSIDPWDTLVVSEQGTLTLTGFVEHITASRSPAQVIIKGRDTYKRALDWTAGENVTTPATVTTLGYWVGYFCGLCGLGYAIDTVLGSAIPFNSGVPFGITSVAEILTTLASLAEWQMTVTADGVLHFAAHARPTTADWDASATDLSFEHDRNDTDTRNRVLVWGLNDPGTNGSVTYSASRTVVGVAGTRNMVYASPHIVTLAQAASLGEAALDQFASLENVLATDAIGDPGRRVSDSLGLTHTFLPDGVYLDTLTDIKSVLSGVGYNQTLTAGRRAFRYPSFPVGTVPPGPVDLFDHKFIVGLQGTPIASELVFATLDFDTGSPTWGALGGQGFNRNGRGIATDKAEGKRVFLLTAPTLAADSVLWSYADASDFGSTWTALQTLTTIRALIGAAFPDLAAADIWEVGGLSTDPLTAGGLAFEVRLFNQANAQSGIFTLVSTDAGVTLAIGNGIQGSYAFASTGSTAFGWGAGRGSSSWSNNSNFGIADTAYLGLTYGYGAPGDAGDDELVIGGNFDSFPAYHARGNANRVLWGGGLVYVQAGDISAGTHTLTAHTGLTAAQAYVNNCAFAYDDSRALGLDGSNHAWLWTSGTTWTDLGSVAAATLTAKGLLSLPDSPLHFAVCGSDFGDTPDGGVTWIDRGGGLVGTPNFIAMDY